jgi:hypothetical protein
MCLVECVVLRSENRRTDPEILACMMLIKPFAKHVRFTDVDPLLEGLVRRPREDVDAWTMELLSLHADPVVLGSRYDECHPTAVRFVDDPKAVGVAIDEKETDGAWTRH